jgi:hypothetical protein
LKERQSGQRRLRPKINVNFYTDLKFLKNYISKFLLKRGNEKILKLKKKHNITPVKEYVAMKNRNSFSQFQKNKGLFRSRTGKYRSVPRSRGVGFQEF